MGSGGGGTMEDFLRQNDLPEMKLVRLFHAWRIYIIAFFGFSQGADFVRSPEVTWSLQQHH